MNCERAKVIVRGLVQGVGFRPFVYHLANELKLTGWVMNSPQGVHIEVEGVKEILDQFLLRLEAERPHLAIIQSLECSFLETAGLREFEIRASGENGAIAAFILPDIATCAECLREIFDPRDRRHLYPFANCTHCGPRFTIIESLPYDRARTSMWSFTMCPECDREYHDPNDRRFHAQPIACPKCGPQLELWDVSGNVLARHHDALLTAAEAIRSGHILALKGLGGFQLLVAARAEESVRRLRLRKHREEKPFALMHPSLASIRDECHVSQLEQRLLQSPEAPIVLLARKLETVTGIAPSVAPKNPCLGIMLPSTPLHHLLMRELAVPVVATSGNLASEPICTDELKALERLSGIADYFLVHNRPIVRHVDDSIARILLGREQILRRSRGYAPLPVHVKKPLPKILAVGAHLKNTVALGSGNEIFLSQHIGDLETKEAYIAFRNIAADLPRLYATTPEVIACDLHPDYLSSQFARGTDTPIHAVQHHHAHVLSCMAENELEPPVLGVAWDGTGYGPDATIWGGEFLLTDEAGFERVGHFRQFKLPGGDACGKQPRRSALGVLYEIFGAEVFERHDLVPLRDFSKSELPMIRQMLEKSINAPATSSVGRLFDAVASLAGLRQRASFEGQAAMELEFVIQPKIEDAYSFAVLKQAAWIVDWQPMILEIVQDIQRELPVGLVAAKFHNTLAEMVVGIARKIGQPAIVLTGGCFQNKYLTERLVKRLGTEGFRPYWHQRVPPNDGGLALGQIMAAAGAAKTKPKE